MTRARKPKAVCKPSPMNRAARLKINVDVIHASANGPYGRLFDTFCTIADLFLTLS
jgi:hypothetical protein